MMDPSDEEELVNNRILVDVLTGSCRGYQKRLEWFSAEAKAGRIPYLQIDGDQKRFNVPAVRRALAERAAGEYAMVTNRTPEQVDAEIEALKVRIRRLRLERKAAVLVQVENELLAFANGGKTVSLP